MSSIIDFCANSHGTMHPSATVSIRPSPIRQRSVSLLRAGLDIAGGLPGNAHGRWAAVRPVDVHRAVKAADVRSRSNQNCGSKKVAIRPIK